MTRALALTITVLIGCGHDASSFCRVAGKSGLLRNHLVIQRVSGKRELIDHRLLLSPATVFDLGRGRMLVAAMPEQRHIDHFMRIVDFRAGTIESRRLPPSPNCSWHLEIQSVVQDSHHNIVISDDCGVYWLGANGDDRSLAEGTVIGLYRDRGDRIFIHGISLTRPAGANLPPSVQLVDWKNAANPQELICAWGTASERASWAARGLMCSGLDCRAGADGPVEVTETSPSGSRTIGRVALSSSHLTGPLPFVFDCPYGLRGHTWRTSVYFDGSGFAPERHARGLDRPVAYTTRSRMAMLYTLSDGENSRAATPLGVLEGEGELVFSMGDHGDLWAWSVADSTYEHFESIEAWKRWADDHPLDPKSIVARLPAPQTTLAGELALDRAHEGDANRQR